MPRGFPVRLCRARLPRVPFRSTFESETALEASGPGRGMPMREVWHEENSKCVVPGSDGIHGRLFRVQKLQVQQPGWEDLSDQVRECPMDVPITVRFGYRLSGRLRGHCKVLPEKLSGDLGHGTRNHALKCGIVDFA